MSSTTTPKWAWGTTKFHLVDWGTVKSICGVVLPRVMKFYDKVPGDSWRCAKCARIYQKNVIGGAYDG